MSINRDACGRAGEAPILGKTHHQPASKRLAKRCASDRPRWGLSESGSIRTPALHVQCKTEAHHTRGGACALDSIIGSGPLANDARGPVSPNAKRRGCLAPCSAAPGGRLRASTTRGRACISRASGGHGHVCEPAGFCLWKIYTSRCHVVFVSFCRRRENLANS